MFEGFDDMETTLYQDNMENRNFVDKLKSNMSLDLSSGQGASKLAKLGQFLNSPEALPFLKLSSPDLERLVIQHNGMVQQTSTPTPTQILFPKTVTEEQEAYARGFMDALAKLHEKQQTQPSGPAERKPELTALSIPGMPVTSAAFPDGGTFLSALAGTPQSSTFVELQNASASTTTAGQNYFSTTTMLPGSVLLNPSAQHAYSAASYVPLTVLEQQGTSLGRGLKRTAAQAAANASQTAIDGIPQPLLYANGSAIVKLKEEPQTVPSLDSGSPPLSPIDMDHQESQKLERKRARNRIAARKCRFRKLQQIQKLEERVDELKKENGKLSGDAVQLRDHVAKLKQQILDHVNSGCVVVMPIDSQH